MRAVGAIGVGLLTLLVACSPDSTQPATPSTASDPPPTVTAPNGTEAAADLPSATTGTVAGDAATSTGQGEIANGGAVTTSSPQPSDSTSSTGTTAGEGATSTDADPPCESERGEQTGTLIFYASCGLTGDLAAVPVFRDTPTQPDLQEALAALVSGTTEAEKSRGLSSGFDSVEERSEIMVLVEVGADGVAVIDFTIGGARWHPGTRAGTTAQLLSFLDPLEATVFAMSNAAAIDRSGQCWGEADCDGVTTREDWAGQLFLNFGTLTDGNCFPGKSPLGSSGCNFGAAVTASPPLNATVTGIDEGATLVVRSGPGPDYFPITELGSTAGVTVTDRVVVAPDGRPWRLIVHSRGVGGWVDAAFLEIE